MRDAYTRCACGAMVLTGETAPGVTVTVEPDRLQTYVVFWGNGEPMPQLRPSAGYPVHRCPQQPSQGAQV
jgi:hypothetical protein